MARAASRVLCSVCACVAWRERRESVSVSGLGHVV